MGKILYQSLHNNILTVRYFAVCYFTVPGPPVNIQRLCTVVVWQPPLQPNGNIVGYDLDFTSLTSLVSVGAGVSFYITDSSARTTGTRVRVSCQSSLAITARKGGGTLTHQCTVLVAKKHHSCEPTLTSEATICTGNYSIGFMYIAPEFLNSNEI